MTVFFLSSDNGAEPATLIESVERRLRDEIVRGTLAPDVKLRVGELKERYAVGASPIREALSRLVGEGLITFSGNRGFRVRGLSPQDLADIAYMRAAIEIFALQTSIERASIEWEGGIVASLHALVTLTREAEANPTSLDIWNAAHDRFHEALIANCGSVRIFETQRRLAEQHCRYLRLLVDDNLPRDLIIGEHQQLAQAAISRDTDRAISLLNRHMLITSEYYTRFVSNNTQAVWIAGV